MKPINDYIVERIRIDNVKPTCDFPINGTIDDMIKFLKMNGFKETRFTFGNIFALLNKKSTKQFVCYNKEFDAVRLWFADTTNKITNDNPVFLISFIKGNNQREFRYSGEKFNNQCSQQEFIEMLNKCFDF